MALVKLNHFSGGARLTPGGSAGLPHLAEILRGAADDAALAAAASRLQVESVPLDSNTTGLLLYTAEVVEAVYADAGGTPGPKTLIPTGETVAAGLVELAADRRTCTFEATDSHTSAVVSYLRRMEQPATLVSANAETYTLVDGQTLTAKIDEGDELTATFETADFADIGNATAAEVLAVMNTDLTGSTTEARNGFLVLRSDTEGYDAAGVLSSIEVTGGTANAALGFSTTAVQGTGVSTQKA